MRKVILVIIVIGFIFSLFSKPEKNEIKVRVVPNSNEECDIQIKNEVKEIVSEYLKIVYDEDYTQCSNNIENTYEMLEEALITEGYSVDVDFGYHTLYNKTYNGSAIENKNSLALIIKIEEAKGDNWWGVIYPNLLTIEGEDEYKYQSLFVDLYNYVKER